MDPLIYVLLAAGGISVFLGERGDAVIIAAVVLLNATVGVIQEGKAQKALESLKADNKEGACPAGRKALEMDAAELVPGDRVLLNAGQQVPADLRLVRSENMKVQEASLTGESVPVEKDAQYVASTGTLSVIGKIWHICQPL
ncbi:MAG: HAD-IC family P-type ATPase [Roseburia sp.]